jgi:hypothetical protein
MYSIFVGRSAVVVWFLMRRIWWTVQYLQSKSNLLLGYVARAAHTVLEASLHIKHNNLQPTNHTTPISAIHFHDTIYLAEADMTALLLETFEKSSTACKSSTSEETFDKHQATIAQKVAAAAKEAVEAYTDAKLGFSPPTKYHTGPLLFEVDMKRLGLSFEEQE